MITNNKHKNFADDYLLTNNSVLSYQKIYPNASLHSAQTKSGVLLKKVEIKEYIKQKQDKIRLERENSQIDAIKKESKANTLKREKAIEMVSNVAKIMYNKIAKENKTADVMAFNSTIERLAKMDGWDKSTKIEQTIVEKRIVDDLYIEE